MESAARQLGDGLAQAAEHVIEREQGTAAKLDEDRLLDLVSTVLFGFLGPIRQSAVVVRLCHFATVLAFKPYRAARARVLSATTTVVSHDICPIPVGLMNQLIRALGSVKAVAEDSCTNSTRTAAVPRAITVTTKHATMKTRMIVLQLPRQIQRTCPEAWSVKALVSISTNVRPTAPTRA